MTSPLKSRPIKLRSQPVNPYATSTATQYGESPGTHPILRRIGFFSILMAVVLLCCSAWVASQAFSSLPADAPELISKLQKYTTWAVRMRMTAAVLFLVGISLMIVGNKPGRLRLIKD